MKILLTHSRSQEQQPKINFWNFFDVILDYLARLVWRHETASKKIDFRIIPPTTSVLVLHSIYYEKH
jgi:hypothetical protein